MISTGLTPGSIGVDAQRVLQLELLLAAWSSMNCLMKSYVHDMVSEPRATWPGADTCWCVPTSTKGMLHGQASSLVPGWLAAVVVDMTVGSMAPVPAALPTAPLPAALTADGSAAADCSTAPCCRSDPAASGTAATCSRACALPCTVHRRQRHKTATPPPGATAPVHSWCHWAQAQAVLLISGRRLTVAAVTCSLVLDVDDAALTAFGLREL